MGEPRRRIPEHLKREAETQRDTTRFFRTLGARVYVTSEIRRRRTSTKGMWDQYIIVPRNGKTAWFEDKQPGEGLTAEQEIFKALHYRTPVLFFEGGMAEARQLARELGLAP